MPRPNIAAILLAAGCGPLGFAQSPAPGSGQQPPVTVKRQLPPAPTNSSRPPVPPLLQKYDFGAQLQALQDLESPAPVAPDVNSSGEGGKQPKDVHPDPDIPLSPTAVEAVRMSETWRGAHNVPAAGADGRVVYAFGGGLPVLVCAPLRVCILELQAGEKIVGEPQIGDSVRWNISPGMYGDGDQATQMIVLKPQEAGLDTNLLVATDRRAYYLRLVSKPREYVARVAFRYPEDENSRKWKQIEQRSQERDTRHQADILPAMITAEKLDFGYKVIGGDEHLRPVRVYDDGVKTYIQMKPEMQNREAPALVVLGVDGQGEMTNYRVREQTYIVDRIFDRARLVLGSGRKAQKVEISREPKG